ncbi:MAG: hypothetical protein HC822_25045 [Oscillochloris sp.]|nr:hypothetical protein [Oscillochloris sp.]
MVAAVCPGAVAIARRFSFLDPLAAGLLLALIGYTSLYYLLFAAVYSLVFVALWAPYRSGMRAVLGWLARAALIAFSAVFWLAPLLGSIIASAELVGQTERVNPLLIARSANLLDLFLPSYLHPLWGEAVAALGPRWHPAIAAWNAALGYTAIGLALIAVVRARSGAWRWLIIALVGAILALGPQLRIGDWQTGLPLPYRALLSLPGFSIGQRPGHFVLVTILALVPLTALGLQALLDRFTARRRMVLGLVAGLMVLEYAVPPVPLQRPLITAAALALEAGQGGLFVIPEQKGQIRSLQDQLVHGRPIVGGFLARVGEHPLIDETPLLNELWRVEPLSNRMILPPGADPAMLLRAYGFTTVVAEWEFMSAEREARARDLLAAVLPAVQPTFSSENVSIYPVPDGQVQPFAFFDTGWYRAEHNGERSWRWMSGEAAIVLVNPTDRLQSVTLSLAGESYRIERRLEIALNGAALGTWDMPAPPARVANNFRFWLPPGRHSLTLRAPSESVEPHGAISIAFTTIMIR